MVQVIKSLQDPLEMGNNLPESLVISGNEAWNRNVLNADGKFTETGQILRCPAGCSRWWVRRLGRPGETDGRQFHGRYQQTIGPSRAEGTSTRQIGDTNQLTQVYGRGSMSGLVHEHGRLERCD